MIGKTILNYKIIEKIGGGGMGVVYKATDTKLDRTVALKFLPEHLHMDKEAEQRFISEAKAASSFDHPNICTIYDINKTEDDQLFIVMAYYEGETLKKKLENGPHEINEAVAYSIQIAQGLERAHEAGIIHRDIKPANIMITKRGEAKILDFGLAKTLNDPGITKFGSTMGTAAYMSPEQARGAEVNHQTDIWSLGVMIYQMITGKLPFAGEYEQALIYSILNEEPKSIREYLETVSSSLVGILNKCLEKDPANRYQTITELIKDLELFQIDPDFGFNTKTLKIESVNSKKQKGKKILNIAAIIIFIVALSFVLPSGWQKIKELVGLTPATSEQHLLILPFTNISGDANNQAFCDGLMETLSSNLTQVERFQGSLWVVPASEVIRNKISSPKEAYKMFGANLAVTGSLQFLGNILRLTLNLVDAEKLRQISSSVIDVKKENISLLQDRTVIKLLEMLNIELKPGQEDILNAGNTTDPEAYEYYVRGRGYLQRYENVENIDEAIRLFSLSTESDTHYSLAYAGLGESYWRKYESTKNNDLVKKAYNNCEKAFNLDSTLAPVNITLGLVYSGTGKYDEAIKKFNLALSQDPTNSEAYRGLAKAYQSIGRINDAESTFKRAIKLKPDYWAGYSDLGVFYYNNSKYEHAIEQFKEVIKLTPDNARGYNNLGAIYYMQERWAETRDMFEKSLKIKKSYGNYSNLATLYYIEGKYEEAAKTYEQALEMNDNDYLTWGNLAAAYYRIPDKKDKAIETYKHEIKIAEEGLKINPNDAEAISNIASYSADIDDKTKSLNLIKKALRMAPGSVDVMYRAASIYEHLGDREKALNWISKAIQNGYSRSDIENQPELKDLVADERYQKIVAQINKK
jgi:serine/threonine protein kinase/Tfp pilus assembly protein PilF